MRNQRMAHRFRLSIGMILVLLAALGSFYLLELMNRADEDIQADLKANEPDYIIEKFSFVRMTKEGKPSYIIAGDKLTHRPIDDSSEIDKPRVRSLSGDTPPMDILANTARVDEANSRVTLNGQVKIDRAAAPNVQALHLATEKLVIFPDEDRMETDQPVKMKLGDSTATANSMRANNATRQMRLEGNGTLMLPPRAQ
ncbi:LPS export ABC transporter periplasmic protein LptC [Pseudoduganella sp. DS3]|uniref:LPS export ABC transporter periplasmic protein LptC n=1 Tax=Pseudoduganella guangdongensis TaxID=2692179 RepID=A0A6N9HJ15_9BURK|nr:LPS export ABC transporter periplasmic protein LptC [Pseudoduganella guangdongensis]MYN02785.1 LPS export ABC transporter periplasmic protein LptC [Pseudoduganella guangdongensis]